MIFSTVENDFSWKIGGRTGDMYKSSLKNDQIPQIKHRIMIAEQPEKKSNIDKLGVLSILKK